MSLWGIFLYESPKSPYPLVSLTLDTEWCDNKVFLSYIWCCYWLLCFSWFWSLLWFSFVFSGSVSICPWTPVLLLPSPLFRMYYYTQLLFPPSVLRIESRVSNILDKFFTREQHPQPPTMWKLVGRSCRILLKELWVLIRTLHPTPLFKWGIKTDFFIYISKQGRNFMYLLSPTQIDFIEKWNGLLGAFN